jgi:DNA-3-methyladenine glycosylase
VSAGSIPLDPQFFARPSVEVAPALLGTVLVSTVGGRLTAGRIVETEAYVGPDDPASHAAERIGRTRRNESMFGAPGIAYVYRIYGVHWCLNAVTDRLDFPGAVLIRALEPLDGLETMRERRRGVPDRGLTSGPGKLASALGITGDLDGHPLRAEPLLIAAGDAIAPDAIEVGPRIGITRAADWPLRFCVRLNPHVSRR